MQLADKIHNLKQEIGKIIIGKENEIELMAICLLFNGHILLESVPGTGKTLLAKSFAAAIGGQFSRIQFTPDVLPSDITGIQFFNPKIQEFELRPGPIIANIVLADEINRATPRTQSSLLEVMEESQVTIDGITLPLKMPFMVIATQNPVESQQGTFPLPAAQMDRFFMKLKVDYPSYDDERKMMKVFRGRLIQEKTAQVFSTDEIEQIKTVVLDTRIEEDIEAYLLSIVRETRNHQDIELGISPRGTLALMRASQGKAFLNGRNFVVPDDVKFVAPFVLGHRIHLSIEGALTKTPEQVIAEIVETTTVPVEAGANR